MRVIVLASLACFIVMPAKADIFRYTCRVDGKSLIVRVDDVKETLQYKGLTYKIKIQESCTNYGWRAERNGLGFDFCTATQGYASFQENGSRIQCEQNRR